MNNQGRPPSGIFLVSFVQLRAQSCFPPEKIFICSSKGFFMKLWMDRQTKQFSFTPYSFCDFVCNLCGQFGHLKFLPFQLWAFLHWCYVRSDNNLVNYVVLLWQFLFLLGLFLVLFYLTFSNLLAYYCNYYNYHKVFKIYYNCSKVSKSDKNTKGRII